MKKGQLVVVTTEFRGVFFGAFQSMEGDTIILKDARNCLYWPSSVRGFMGLASDGPPDDSRVGPSVAEVTLLKVTAILRASTKAAKLWKSAPWK